MLQVPKQARLGAIRVSRPARPAAKLHRFKIPTSNKCWLLNSQILNLLTPYSCNATSWSKLVGDQLIPATPAQKLQLQQARALVNRATNIKLIESKTAAQAAAATSAPTSLIQQLLDTDKAVEWADQPQPQQVGGLLLNNDALQHS